MLTYSSHHRNHLPTHSKFRTQLLGAMGIPAEKLVTYDETGRTVYVADEVVWLAPPPCGRCEKVSRGSVEGERG